MIKSKVRTELLEENMWKLMITLSPIAIISMSINSINTFVDAVFIGQFLGEKAVAGIALAFPLAMITNGLTAMIGVGGSSILSRAIGEEDFLTQKKIFGTTTVLSLVVSVILIALGWIFARPMIAAIGGKGEVLELAVTYYQTLILGAFFHLFGVSSNMLIRAEGKIKEAMIIAIASTVLNMILNPIFLGYFKMGIEGTAIATILSMVFFSCINIWYFKTNRASYPIDHSYFKLEKEIAKPLVAIGASGMMLQIMFVVKQMVVFKTLDIYGSEWDLTFMGACYRVLLLMLLPSFGFSTALQPVVGMNYGAKDYARVRNSFRVFTISSTIFMFFLWGFFMSFPEMVLGWLLPNSELAPLDIIHFRLMMGTGILYPFFFLAIIMYQSIGNAKVAGVVMVLREIVFFLPFVFLLPLWMGVTGVYFSSILQNLIVSFIAVYLVWSLFKKWKKEELESNLSIKTNFSEK